MALSQLITTTDIAKNNVGINNSAANTATNALILGNGQNIGIGTNAPLAALHIGAATGVIPAIYVADSTGATLPAVTGGAGMFSSVAGVPTFTSSTGPKAIFTLDNQMIGSGTLTAGSVTITNANITVDSVVFLTRITGGAIVDTGTLSVAVSAGSFVVTSTVATDVGSFNYIAIDA